MCSFMYLDCWVSKTDPIAIPRMKKDDKNTIKECTFELNTGSGDVYVTPCSMNSDLITGHVKCTPPKNKLYKKGDKVMFHKDNVINIY